MISVRALQTHRPVAAPPAVTNTDSAADTASVEGVEPLRAGQTAVGVAEGTGPEDAAGLAQSRSIEVEALEAFGAGGVCGAGGAVGNVGGAAGVDGEGAELAQVERF